MALIDKNTLKDWFSRGKKPLASQFANWIDSYWHKAEKIPMSEVENLTATLNTKAEKLSLTAETNARVEGDTNLQNQIDGLQKITNIRGNIDTHADLLALDTDSIRENDSYIVEVDETRMQKTTVYAWNGTEWIYTGEWASGVDLTMYQKLSEKGQPNGYAPLDADNKVPAEHLPPFVIPPPFNIGNSDITQSDYMRTWDLNHGQLNIQGNGSVFGKFEDVTISANGYKVSAGSTIINSQMLAVDAGQVYIGAQWGSTEIYFRSPGGYPETANTFLWVNYEGKLEFLTADEFEAKLGMADGIGGVTSVNGETGAVLLTANNVGAEPAFAKKTAFNKDFGTTTNTVLTGDSTLNITKQGFVKNGSSDSYLLLGGGGHKLLSTLPIYEEGNWTPSVYSTGNARFSITKAEYVRTGRAIDIYCDLTITTAGTNTIDFHLNGLPFIPKSSAMIGTCLIVGGGKEFIDTYCAINVNQSILYLGKRTDHTSGYVNILHNEFKVGARIVVTGKYFI